MRSEINCVYCGSSELETEEEPDIIADRSVLIVDYWCKDCKKPTVVEYVANRVLELQKVSE